MRLQVTDTDLDVVAVDLREERGARTGSDIEQRVQEHLAAVRIVGEVDVAFDIHSETASR